MPKNSHGFVWERIPYLVMADDINIIQSGFGPCFPETITWCLLGYTKPVERCLVKNREYKGGEGRTRLPFDTGTRNYKRPRRCFPGNGQVVDPALHGYVPVQCGVYMSINAMYICLFSLSAPVSDSCMSSLTSVY